MANKPLRVVIDTNLWISFLIRNDYSSLDKLLFSKECILLFSDELLAEFLDVVKRPKFRRYFAVSDVESILETIEEYADFVKVISTTNACRDPKDNFLLALATDGNADILLSGDKDLLELGYFNRTRIMSLTEFLSEQN